MGMGPCPTGYCGHPCTCPEAYSHTDASDAKAVIGILQKRLTELGEAEASKKHDEPMVEHTAKTLIIKVLRCDHVTYQVNLELHKFIPHSNPESINSVSGIRSIYKDGDTFTIKSGLDENASGWVRYEIFNYKGDISLQITTTSRAFPDMTAYVSFTDSKIYLPKEI